MTFKSKPDEFKSGQDCEDFKPMFWDRRHCKLINKCSSADSEYIVEGRFGGYCTGVYENRILERWDKEHPKLNKHR